MRRGGIFLRILCPHADNAMRLRYNANEPHLKTMVRARVCVITLHLQRVQAHAVIHHSRSFTIFTSNRVD